ncbi:MAG: hypothetical protein AAF750_01780 [Planctomycetota bacterium]
MASVARRFEVDQKTVRSYRCRAAQGWLELPQGGHCGPTKLTEADLVTLRGALASEPGLTLRELRGKLGVPVVLSTVSRALGRLGMTLKKKLIASE